MISTMRTAGVVLLAISYGAQRALAVDVANCEALLEAVEAVTTSTTSTVITMTSGFDCISSIPIASGQTITIDGVNNSVLNVGADFFASDTSNPSVFVNSGTLTIENVDFTEDPAPDEGLGVRAIYNEGTLTVRGCAFKSLNTRKALSDKATSGGAIYTETSGLSVTIEDCEFSSNLAAKTGGAISAAGTDVLGISTSVFTNNEVNDNESGDETLGGDVYAARGVELSVVSSNFTGGATGVAGASIWCCGADITNARFSGAETETASGNYGAVTSNLPGEPECENALFVDSCTFTGCSAYSAGGKGGSIAIFDTTAIISNSYIIESSGTGVLFESSSAEGAHQLKMTSVEFNYNSDGAEEFASSSGSDQGSALVINNSGLSEDDEPITMGILNNIYCFSNEPYECEVVYNLADVDYEGDTKCNVCNLDGEKQSTDDDEDLASERSTDSSSDSGSQSLIVGLSVALGATLVIIGVLAVYKFRARKNARRLMEDMADNGL